MSIYTPKQKSIAENIHPDSVLSDWKDWKWHIRNTIRDIKTFEAVLGLNFSKEERKHLEMTVEKFPLAVTPYYVSLINKENYRDDPVFKQAFPSVNELIVESYEMSDPLSEDTDSPAECVTHRYPDRVLFHVSNMCAMYCRHCTRKRKVGDKDSIPGRKTLEKGLEYIRKTPVIRDVLISGGDPLMLSDSMLKWILDSLSSIEHVEVIRMGTRIPVVLPYRVTDKLAGILGSYPNLWINTHFNHPREITESSMTAVRKLTAAGIPMGNQSVLLAGVNDCPYIMKKLVHKLVQNRVRPYYLYQCDLAEGLSHFRTPVGKGIEIVEALRGHTSGFAVPVYVIDAPGGGGKIPVSPNYVVSWSTNKVILRNYEGVICSYKEPDSYEPVFCDRKCEACTLDLNVTGEENPVTIGIERLMSDYDDQITLVPQETERMKRRTSDD